jgi:hypothetical protein
MEGKMKVVFNIFVLFLLVLMKSSCGTSLSSQVEMQHRLDKIHYDSVKKLLEDEKALGKEIDVCMAKEKVWHQKYDAYIKSLSKGELQAESELVEANKQNAPRYLQARRNLEKLLEESGDVSKLITYKSLNREAEELLKQKDVLKAKYQELEKRRKQLVRYEEAQEKQRVEEIESRRHRETVAAVRSIGNQQWLQQQQLIHQQQMLQQQQWMQQQQLQQQQLLWGK